jgi:nitrogen regulatory protein PII
MVDTARMKLVTIIGSSELQDRFERDLRRLGASGYTISKVDGRGRHGPRTRGMFDVGNVRLETIVSPEIAETLLAHLSREAETTELVAFAQDVEAVPRKHFA